MAKYIVLATSNKNKIEEFKFLLGNRPDIVFKPYDGFEIQGTSEEIIKEKAKYAWDRYKNDDVLGIIVEDTSFYINSLGNVMGSNVKMWLSEFGAEGIYERACTLAVQKIDGLLARAESWLCYYDGKKFVIKKGQVKGKVVPPKGDNGFGWDSIFQPESTDKDMKFTNKDMKFTNKDMKFTNKDMKFTNKDMKFTNKDMKFTNKDMKFTNKTYSQMTFEEKNLCSPRKIAIDNLCPFIKNCNIDVVIGLEWGDEAKGKIVYHLLNIGKYTHCIRWQGSCNAGHTIFIKNKNNSLTKVVTQMVPSGALYNLTSIIGDSCKIDPTKFVKELDRLKEYVPNIIDIVKVSANCGIIEERHIKEDAENDKVGTTHSGVGPANRDFYARVAKRVIDCMEPNGRFCGCEVINTTEYWMQYNYLNIIAEGAQGYELDVSNNNYPFVTSTHCTPGFINTMGLDIKKIRKIYGAAKMYTTYVGNMEFGNDQNPDFKKFQVEGNEYGTNTGRPRKVDYLDLKRLKLACYNCGVDTIVLSKADILDKTKIYKCKIGDEVLTFNNMEELQEKIKDYFSGSIKEILFSYSPDHI